MAVLVFFTFQMVKLLVSKHWIGGAPQANLPLWWQWWREYHQQQLLDSYQIIHSPFF